MQLPSGRLILALSIAVSAAATVCVAQELASLDLTNISPRTELRKPPSTEDLGAHGQGGILALHDGCESHRFVGELKSTLISLDRTSYSVGDQPLFQVQIENTGSSAIKIPVSPNLADLQPADPRQKFSYSRIVVKLMIGGKRWSTDTGASVTLYGNDSSPHTMLTLRPGEWVEITARGKITLPEDFAKLTAAGDVVSEAYVLPTIYRDETLLTSAASATSSESVCLHTLQGRSLPLQITPK